MTRVLLIGFGLAAIPDQHQHAPAAVIAFNTSPADTVEAALRASGAARS